MTTKSKAKARSSEANKNPLSKEFKKLLTLGAFQEFKTVSVAQYGAVKRESELLDLFRRTHSSLMLVHSDNALLHDYSYVGRDAGYFMNSSEPFPMAIRAIRWRANSCLVLLEQAPSIRNIFWCHSIAENVKEKDTVMFSLPFPWTHFLIHLETGNQRYDSGEFDESLQESDTSTSHPIYSAKKKLKKKPPRELRILRASLLNVKFSTKSMVPSFRKNVKIYRAPFPNSYSSGSMCFSVPFSDPQTSFVHAIEDFISGFYGTVFNTDLDLDYDLFENTKFSDDDGYFSSLFKQWSDYSIEDMVDPEKIPFAPVGSEEFWEKSPVFSSDLTNSLAFRDTTSIFDLKDTTLTRYTKDAKKERVILKDYPEAKKAIETSAILEDAVNGLFNITTKTHLAKQMDYYSAQVKVSDLKTDKSKAKFTPVLSLYHGPKNVFSVKKRTSLSTRGLGIRPIEVENFHNDLGTQPPYGFDVDYDKFKESIDILRKGLGTGPIPLPPGLRYWDPCANVLVFERPPSIKTIAFLDADKASASNNKSDRESYKIFVPWTQYWVAYNNKLTIQAMYATASSHPMSHKDYRLGILPLPNMYYESKVCTPNFIAPANNISEVMLNAYNAVWGSNYNMDLIDGVQLFLDTLAMEREVFSYNYTSSQLQLMLELRTGFKRRNLSGFLEVWAMYPDPNDLLRVIPAAVPRNNHAGFEEMEFNCTCAASNVDEPAEFCECQPPDPKQLPVGMSTIIRTLRGDVPASWIYNKASGLDASLFSMYDLLFLHAQAHSAKMTY